MLGHFKIRVGGNEMTCSLDDDGVWHCEDDTIQGYLRDLYSPTTNGGEWLSPGYGAFMRMAFRSAYEVLDGYDGMVADGPVPSPGALL